MVAPIANLVPTFANLNNEADAVVTDNTAPSSPSRPTPLPNMSANPLTGDTSYDAESGAQREDGKKAQAKKLYRNFVYMSLCFSANHGSVTSIIALSSSFDPTLGSYSKKNLSTLTVVSTSG